MSSQYFASQEQSEAHAVTAIVFWGEPFERPNVLLGVTPFEPPECEACFEPQHPMRTVVFDMDDELAEAFELAIAKWREQNQ